jgi:uncharacterized membrane protein
VNSQRAFEWQFGGWTGLTPTLAWSVFAAVAIGGILLAIWMYRSTLQPLKPGYRVIFILLRSAFFLVLLVCLAGPTRVERTYDTGQDTRPLAIVVDHSASMTTPDSRGLSRLTAAVRVWKLSETAGVHTFPGIRYFSFSTALKPAGSLDEAVNHDDPGAGTALYDSLEQVVHSGPGGGYGGVVCLTDGLDTTNDNSDKLSELAVQNHTPLYFAAGENQQAAQDMLIVRDTAVPGQVLRKTEFSATAMIEANSAGERDVPVSLWQDNTQLAGTTLHLRAGSNFVPWSVPVQSHEPGLMHLSWRLGDPTQQETVAATVRVVAQNQINVLFFQGTLDWGFRFITTALGRDSSFAVTGLFSPDLSLTQVVTANPQAPTSLPDSVNALLPFQIIVLANTSAAQLSEAQQAALAEYVRRGGGLLFLLSDTTMAQTFSRTSLEAMLPVVFDPAPPVEQPDESLAEFQARMESLGGANRDDETGFAADALARTGLDPLKDFALPAGTSRQDISKLFGHFPNAQEAEVPKFASYAHVAFAKAGAEVLAVHPDDKTSANQPRPLLVTQRFGQGQVTALLTDALWRWKLSLPSTSHASDAFWQQLFLALVGPGSTMHFSAQPYFAALGEQTLFKVEGGSGMGSPTVTLIPPGAGGQALVPVAGTQPGEWDFQVTPNQPGSWRLQVQDVGGSEIETLLRVSHASHSTELSGLPPDTEGLRKLAQATGGTLLNDGVPENWSGKAATPESALVSEHVQPLWNSWLMLLVALSLYVIELIWRRRVKLL